MYVLAVIVSDFILVVNTFTNDVKWKFASEFVKYA